MRNLLLLTLLPICFSNIVLAGYVKESPEWYAYLAVKEPEQLKRIIQKRTKSSNPDDKIVLRTIITAMATDEFYVHKRALERLRDDHVQITVRNNGLDTIRLAYYKIKDKSAATTTIASYRMRYLEPGKKNRVTLLKDKILIYQVKAPCRAKCKRSEDHAHWGKKIEVSFQEGQLVAFNSMIKVVSKQ